MRVSDTIDLMEHNEAVVGLVNLLDNLADFEINLSAGERVALEGFMAAFGVEIGSPLRYQVIHWDHDLPDEPTLLYSEIGVDGFEVRKVEEYRSGLKDFASAGVRSGDSHLSTATRTSTTLPRRRSCPSTGDLGRCLTLAQ